VLIAGGAVLEVGDANGLTPLLAAVKSGYESAALVLVDRGASIGIKDSQGRTALHYACDAVATGKMQELACALVDAGSDVNAVDANGEKPLLNEDLSVYIQSKQVADPVKNGVERTLAIIKPDAVRRGLAQTIIGVATAQGFAVVGRRHLQLTPSRAAEFYAEHNGRPFFKDLVKFMSSGPIVVLILAKVNAIAEWRALMGPTNVATAKASAPKSIRARFGTDFPIFPFHKEEAGRPGTTNATHGSDSLVSAGREIRFYFPAAASEVVPALEWTSAFVSDKMNTVLLQGLTELSKEKPTDPIVWLGEWLLRNNPAKPQIASR
jgi:nucleoside-diphosphate kinase